MCVYKKYIYISVSRPHAATDPSWKVCGHSGLELKVFYYLKEKSITIKTSSLESPSRRTPYTAAVGFAHFCPAVSSWAVCTASVWWLLGHTLGYAPGSSSLGISILADICKRTALHVRPQSCSLLSSAKVACAPHLCTVVKSITQVVLYYNVWFLIDITNKKQ